MDTLWRDVKFSLRTMARSPGFTAAAVVSLALGIGANTTVFTLINAVFLNPLPVERSSELVAAYTVDANGPQALGGLLQTSYPNFRDYRERSSVFSGMAAYSFAGQVSVVRGREQEQAIVEVVTGNYFDVLGVRPRQGRFFAADEDRTPLSHPVVVLAYGYWQRLGADRGLLGATLTINGLPHTVVGIAPEGFRGINSLFSPDLWVPSMMYDRMVPAQFTGFLESRRALAFGIAARLRPGVSIAQAEAQLQTIGRALEAEYPVENKGRTLALTPIAQAAIFPAVRGPLVLGGTVLMTVVGLVLLVACANVANLLVARGIGRRQEIAVRIALGAGRLRLVRQLVTESVLLALAGGGVGLLLAVLARDGIWALRPPFVAQNFVEFSFDLRVLAFTAAVAAVTGVVFGLLPALQATRANVVDTLKEETRTAGRSRRRLRVGNTLVVAQVALSLVALVAAGLFLRSLQAAQDIDPGFDVDRIAVVLVNPGQAGYEQARAEEFYRQVRERVASVPGVDAASWASNLPLTGGLQRTVIPEGQEADPSRRLFAVANTTTPGYFDTMGTPIRRGRDFTDADRAGTLRAAIVNEVMANRVWPGQDPIGKRFRFITAPDMYEVVGVAATTKYFTLGEDPTSAVFVPLAQNYSDAMVLVVRSTSDPSAALGAALGEIRALDARVPTANPATMDQVLGQSLWPARMGAILLGTLGGLALALATVGLYGVISYSVGQRRHEIGVRMALGADKRHVMRLVLREGMMLVACGLVLGLVGSFSVSRLVGTLLYGIGTADLWAFGVVTLLLALVALAACAIPALRASHTDPVAALHS